MINRKKLFYPKIQSSPLLLPPAKALLRTSPSDFVITTDGILILRVLVLGQSITGSPSEKYGKDTIYVSTLLHMMNES